MTKSVGFSLIIGRNGKENSLADKFSSFYNSVDGAEGERCNYPTRLDTFGCGCSHDCNYCYAKSLLDFRKNWNPKNPKIASVSDISKALRKVRKGEILRLGGMTDCFQPLERVYKPTYQAIKMLNARGIGYLIVTKSDIVADKDYINLMDRELAHIQITVTSTSDENNFLGEKATKPSKRMEAAKRLQDEGFDVALRVSPYIPELVDVGKLSDAGVEKVIVEFLRVNGFIAKWLDYDIGKYRIKEGGYRHLPLEDKIMLVERFTDCFKQVSVCEDVEEHYEYWKENVNYNKDDCCNLRRKDEGNA